MIGGSPLFSEVTGTAASTSNTSYTDPSVGLTISLPSVGGDFMVDVGMRPFISSGAAGTAILMSPSTPAIAAADSMAALFSGAANADQASVSKPSKMSGVASGATITARFRVTAGTGQIRMPWMRVIPVRVG